MKRIVLLVVLIAVVAGGWYAYKEYHRTNADLTGRTPDFEMSAGDLISRFEKDTVASKKYIDKVIAVDGKVKSIDKDGNPVVIALGDAGQMSSVQCSMDSTYVKDYQSIREGDALSIKGMCTGGRTEELFGTDVILNRCVLNKK
ncbi:MAG TPA: hypothetical protein VHK91_01720 [Flavisolibacter sp.]|jgi:RecJ-like exonuclease|nr:hypothetical protein [Flavisolibacter sp.]